MNTEEKKIDEMRIKFLIKYWKMTIMMAVVVTAAVIVDLFVFLSVVANALATGLVPVTLGLWSVGSIITFGLNLVFWEIVFVFTWIIPVMAGFYFWYTKLPDEEQKGWKPNGRRESGDAIGFLVGITWLIMLWVDGRWNLTFDSWTFNDWVFSWLTAAGWDLIIFGIPLIIILILWLVFRRTGEEF